MDTKKLHDQLTEAIIENSGLEQNRDYVGFSKIGDCPRKIYTEYMQKQNVSITESDHFYCYAGYHQEADVANLLIKIGVLDPTSRGKEIVSDISPIFKGHIDGLAMDGALIEIKSVSNQKYDSIKEKGKSLFRHFVQVQLYLRYGKMPYALIIYRNRETYEHMVMYVPYVKSAADEQEKKALIILDAIKDGKAPACTCHKCITNEYLNVS